MYGLLETLMDHTNKNEYFHLLFMTTMKNKRCLWTGHVMWMVRYKLQGELEISVSLCSLCVISPTGPVITYF